MSRETYVVLWCDGDHEVRVKAAAAHVVTLDKRKPVEIDLCEDCGKVMADLGELLERGAEVVAPKAAAPSVEFPCPLCDLVCTSRSGQTKHLKVKHGTNFTEARALASNAKDET